MKVRILGVVLLIGALSAGYFLKVNPEHEWGLALFGLIPVLGYFGVMFTLDVFNKKNLKEEFQR